MLNKNNKNMRNIKSFFITALTLATASCSTGPQIVYIENYAINFNANGGVGSMMPQFFREETPTALTPNSFTLDEHKFAGWSTSANGESEYSDAAEFTATGNDTLYAVWSKFEITPTMIFVEGGTFAMGSDNTFGAGTGGTFNDEGPIHDVTLDSFYIGNYEVTQAEWFEVMGTNPSYFKGDNLPVELVTWYDAIEYCNARSEKEGLQPYYTIDKEQKDPSNTNSDNLDVNRWLITLNKENNGYRLPTESEWEWAAQGGVKSKGYAYSGSDDINDVAWVDTNSNGVSHTVGGKAPNELGIYDMSGNLWEWCWDWYSDGYESDEAQTNPTGVATGSFRCVRGGCWYFIADYCRSINRDRDEPYDKYYLLGFRVARNAE